jgi:hypothetical protein
MTEKAKAKPEILILCSHQEMGDTFIQTACPGGEGGAGKMELNGHTVQMAVLAGDPRVNPSWEERIAGAAGLMLLVRFMDVISMDKVKAIYRSIPADREAPMVVVLFREEGESDFKMSCAACGQKLWVRDQDVGKRGRCPNCKRAFRLPAQDEHLKAQLLIPDAISVLMVDRGSAETCREAVKKLAEGFSGDLVASEEVFDPNVLKQQTMRIQVTTGDTTHGDET